MGYLNYLYIFFFFMIGSLSFYTSYGISCVHCVRPFSRQLPTMVIIFIVNIVNIGYLRLLCFASSLRIVYFARFMSKTYTVVLQSFNFFITNMCNNFISYRYCFSIDIFVDAPFQKLHMPLFPNIYYLSSIYVLIKCITYYLNSVKLCN